MGLKSGVISRGGGCSRRGTRGGIPRSLLGWATAAPGVGPSPSGGAEEGHAPLREKGPVRLSGSVTDPSDQASREEVLAPDLGIN